MTAPTVEACPSPAVEPASARGPLDFRLPPELEAQAPPELVLGRRDAVRMMVSLGVRPPVHATARDLASFLAPGDLVVVNTSATVPAALDATAAGEVVVAHLSTELPTGLWLVEVRRPRDGAATLPHDGEFGGIDLELHEGGTIRLLGRMPGSVRLWVAALDLPAEPVEYLTAHGRPIRYRYVPHDWPIDTYMNSFAVEPGSAEMPSAGRPLTAEVITDLVTHGIGVAPLVLHTGVSSLEGHELPYPERYRVPLATAEAANHAHAAGHRVVAIGTTVVRALETVTDITGRMHPGEGWTDRLITPDDPPRAVDGLLTGWHEPEATHLLMLEAVAGRDALEIAYPEALRQRYRWHEFGDVHLLLRERTVGTAAGHSWNR
ncbi:MAG TPA: S-adenosylmethionine:tRNA ribosyltransferase-isomerase [Microthrixaceae bacterium]|nr:S-adenosylmethionine:tRNA ribosyltransferase-isomerase [Microthrixaceae bacterium]